MELNEMTIEERAAYRVLRARSALIKARRFYGVLVSNVEPVCSRKVETAATNGSQHFWNPDYVEELSQEELEGVQAHETEHDARHHSTRRGHRDPLKWNEACDFAINADLIAEGFKLPKGALLDARFAGMSAEDIYRTRELDEQNKDKPAQQQPEDKPEEEKGEDEGEGGKGEQEQPEEQEGDEQGEQPSDESEGEEGEGSEGDGEGDEAEEGQGAGAGEGEEEGEGEGQGEGQGGSSEGKGEGEGQAEPKGTSGDCGGCGEVLDAAESAGDNAEQDQKWERIVRQAVSLAKKAGCLPGHISRDIERANDLPREWREELRAFFDAGSLFSESWNRPNRRFVGQGLYLPGRQRDGINKAVFLIDTSGSMDAVALACVRNEAQAALDDGVLDEVVVAYGDTQLNRVDTYRSGDEMEFDPRGGGGTRLRPLFDFAAEEHSDASLIVCFTDMEFEDLDSTPQPACPVLFAATGYPDKVRQYLASAPWGSPGIDVGAH